MRQHQTHLLAEHIWWFTTTNTTSACVRLNYSKRHGYRPTEHILLERFGGRLGISGHVPLRFKPQPLRR